MNERLFLQPPEIVDVEGPLIFLAGPIQGAPEWQNDAVSIIRSLDSSIVVASPRKNYPEGTFLYENQVDWETHFLRKAGENGVVSFWLATQTSETPGRAYAQTSRFELAEWKMKHEYEGSKITIGIEQGFGNARYIKRRLSQDCPDVKIADTLETMCLNAVQLARQTSDKPKRNTQAPVPVSLIQWPESRSFKRLYDRNPQYQARFVMALLGFKHELDERSTDEQATTAIHTVISAFRQHYPEFMENGYIEDTDTGAAPYQIDDRLLDFMLDIEL